MSYRHREANNSRTPEEPHDTLEWSRLAERGPEAVPAHLSIDSRDNLGLVQTTTSEGSSTKELWMYKSMDNSILRCLHMASAPPGPHAPLVHVAKLSSSIERRS